MVRRCIVRDVPALLRSTERVAERRIEADMFEIVVGVRGSEVA